MLTSRLRCRGLTRASRGWGTPRGYHPPGPLPRGPGLSLKKVQTKEHHGALPPDPPLKGGGSSPKNPFSGWYKLEGMVLYRLSAACSPHSARLPKGAALRDGRRR